MFKVNLDNWFNTRSRRVVIGSEVEFTLFDSVSKTPLTDMTLLEDILKTLPPEISRDHYPHQLEIRTRPHDNIASLLNEMKKFYRLASKSFIKNGVYIVPIPSLSKDYMFCGMHIHLSFPDSPVDSYYDIAMGMYPFLLSLADHTKNYESDPIMASERINRSHHIGFPYLIKRDFFSNREDSKYKDIIYSPPNDEDSIRLNKPNTIEIRLLDTPSLFSFYKFILEFIYNISVNIRVGNPIIDSIKNQYNEIERLLSLTRILMVSQRYGVNKVFRSLNSEVCEIICDRFSIQFPRETQFEYRERLGISADINGFLQMATHGGWLD